MKIIRLARRALDREDKKGDTVVVSPARTKGAKARS